MNSIPASVWRWMPYNAAGAALLRKITDMGYRDRGTGSTFEALERRGLVLCRYERASIRGSMLFVQITKAGRKMVRDALKITPTRRMPVGTLREWHWQALSKAYRAGKRGVSCEAGRIGWNTWLRLRDYKIQAQEYPLVEERSGMTITHFGIGYYEHSWQRYHDLYPNVEAKPPASPVDPQEPFVEIIQTDRVCRACQGRYVVAVRRTYQQNEKWIWSVSEQEQRIEVKSRRKRERCICQESDLQELHAPLLALLDQLVTQGWQLHFPYHDWYDLGSLVSGVSSLYQDYEKDWYEPSFVREKLLPFMDQSNELDDRNVMRDGEMLYCVNEHTGRGAIYPTRLSILNSRPVALTRAKA